MVMFLRFPRRFAFALEKSLDIVFFLQVCGTLRVHVLHSRHFLVRHFREMPDEANEFPAILILSGVVWTKRGHSRKPHALVADVVKLAVAEILRVSLPHIRVLRIQTLSNGCVPASVIAVANRSMIAV